MTLEGQVLLALWRLYKLDKISMQQKGCIKDQLIRRDLNFYSAIGDCQNLDQLEEKLLDILNYLDAEETICPIIRLSNSSNTPTTIKSYQNQPQKRFRFMSSSNENEILQSDQRVRSNSFQHQ